MLLSIYNHTLVGCYPKEIVYIEGKLSNGHLPVMKKQSSLHDILQTMHQKLFNVLIVCLRLLRLMLCTLVLNWQACIIILLSVVM